MYVDSPPLQQPCSEWRLPTLWEQGCYVTVLCADSDGWFVVADRML